MPRSALPSAAERARVPIGRSFPVTHHESQRALPDEAMVLVLSTDSDERVDLVRCGEALSAILLECTVHGFATCVLTHLTEYPRSRAVVRELIGNHGLPQTLVRVGVAPGESEEPRTPRLPLREILEITK